MTKENNNTITAKMKVSVSRTAKIVTDNDERKQ